MTGTDHRTTLVVGASRGLGRGIAQAFAASGDSVVAVSRTAGAFSETTGSTSPGATGSSSLQAAVSIRAEIADAGDATVPALLLDRYEPETVVLVAGATPHMRPLQEQTWETFSVNWQTDVRISFHWLREILLKPLKPGSKVIVFSSGAALAGSPLSGGYAGAKATQRFITAYAQDEANRAGLNVTFTAILPRFAPETGVGQPAVRAYAAQSGRSLEDFLQQTGPPVTPELAGRSLVELVKADVVSPAYVLSGAGLQELP